MSRLLLVLPLIGCVHTADVQSGGARGGAQPVMSVADHRFLGEPTGMRSQEGCEGCGNPFELDFGAAGQVMVIFPGDDIINQGSWTQSGSLVTVDLGAEPMRFELHGDRLELQDPQYQATLTLAK